MTRYFTHEDKISRGEVIGLSFLALCGIALISIGSIYYLADTQEIQTRFDNILIMLESQMGCEDLGKSLNDLEESISDNSKPIEYIKNRMIELGC